MVCCNHQDATWDTPPHIRVPGFKAQMSSGFQLPTNVYSERQQVMALALGPRQPCERLALSSRLLVSTWLSPTNLGYLGGRWKSSLSES